MKQVRITLGNLLEQRGMSISGIQRLRNEGLKLKDVKQLLDIFER
ncbi:MULTISPECIES: hypothetical protein [Paenibacillus]|uniref:Uncharacterized protein n=1 Tax=Paenibacillus apis TaxID=1792174 RepID=A0A920CN50_9BACL|nr:MULTISPECIES: hypothetical protein [Paenibacillus]GIO43404.1 hypothetical protein J41TS4_31620 [Paenibacillus apis]